MSVRTYRRNHEKKHEKHVIAKIFFKWYPILDVAGTSNKPSHTLSILSFSLYTILLISLSSLVYSGVALATNVCKNNEKECNYKRKYELYILYLFINMYRLVTSAHLINLFSPVLHLQLDMVIVLFVLRLLNSGIMYRFM